MKRIKDFLWALAVIILSYFDPDDED